LFTLYGMASPNVTKVSIFLREVAAPVRFEWVDLFREAQFDPGFLRKNPNAKAPVLVDDDGPGGESLTLFESTAMLIYLAEKFGRFLAPADRPERYETLKWLMLQASGFGPMCGQYVHFSRFAPPGQDYALERYRNETMRLYRVIEGRLGECAYLGGDDYTIADMALFPWAALHEYQGLDWSGFVHLPRWFAAVAERPAVAATMTELKDIMARDAASLASAPQQALDRFLGRNLPV